MAADTFQIEPMQPADLDEVLRIEAASFTEPWTREMFQAELLPSVSLALVVRSAEGVFLGYLCAAVIEEALHISNIAVDPLVRGRGIAKALLQVALTQAAERGARTATLEVRASNEAAQALYRHYGFKVVGRRQRYYAAPVEDAFIMSLDRLDIAAMARWRGERA